MFDVLIKNGKVVDGSGAPWRYADVGIVGDKIAAVGSILDAQAKKEIDARGKIVCPGFIDLHSHADLSLLAGQFVEGRLAQGITTEVVGQDGLSYTPCSPKRLQEWRRFLIGLNGDFAGIDWNWSTSAELIRHYDGKAANAIYLTPHGAIRTEVMGWEPRPATPEEIKKMVALVKAEMAGGAAGLSTGLTYIPCIHATTEELIELCRPVAEYRGILSIHLRSYGPGLLKGIDEAIEIGRQSGVAVHISHLRVADVGNWGIGKQMTEKIDRARQEGLDVTFDLYPYTAGCAPLYALVPAWAQSGGPDVVMERLNNPETLAKIEADMLATGLDWSMYNLSNAPKNKLGYWDGSSVTAAAFSLGMSAPRFILELLRETELNATLISSGGSETDNEIMFGHSTLHICSDGVLVGDHPHPRGYGAFPRVYTEYVKRRNLLSLEYAVFCMTGKSAARLNLNDRGLLRPQFAADVVVFDPETISDQSSYRDGRLKPVGIETVIVNGQIVVDNSEYIGSTAGRGLTPLLNR